MKEWTMKEIKAIIQPFKLDDVCRALEEIPGLPGLTVSDIMGWGKQRGREKGDVAEGDHRFSRKKKVEVVVPEEMVEEIVRVLSETARTGNFGDGKIFFYNVDDVVKIRTGERGPEAI
jgi:nitrogen regulatory protein P-II 1